jgi:outer membrane protein
MKKIMLKTVFISAVMPAMLCSSSQSFSTTLLEVYRQALQSSDAYKSQVYTYLAAKEALPLAYSALLPQVSFDYSYGSSFANGANNSSLSTSSSVSLSQTIFSWASLNGISSAKASVMSAYATFLSAKQTLISDTINDYLTVIQAQKILSIDEDYYKQLKEAKNLKNTTDSSSDASNESLIESTIDQEKVQMINDKQSLSQSVQNLRTLTHHKYSSLTAPLQLEKVQVLNNEEDWVAMAEKNNLNIVMDQAALLSANATLKGARGAFLPTISLSSSTGNSSSTQPGSSVSSYPSTSVSLNASVPIFSGGSLWMTMKEDKYSQQAAQKSLDDTLQSTQSTVRNDYVSVKSAISSFGASLKSVASAEKSLTIVQDGYKTGKYSSYDLVTSLSAVVSAKESLVQNLVSYFEDKTQLKLDSGTLSDQDIDSLNKLFVEPMPIANLDYE